MAIFCYVHFYQADFSTWLQKGQLAFEPGLAFDDKKTEQIIPVIYNVPQSVAVIDKQVLPALQAESAITDDLRSTVPDTIATCWSIDSSFKQALVCRCGQLERDLRSLCHQSIRGEYITAMLERKL